MRLLISALTKFLLGIILVALFLFIPAGSFDYFGGWLFCALLFIPMLILGIILFIFSPELLKKRLDIKEKQKAQKGVVSLSALFFVFGFVVAGLDFRFSLFPLPDIVVIIASIVLLFSYVLYALVLKQNRFLSRVIEVQENQIVIDKGLYGIVRHPMYSATILMFLSIPLVLGSLYSFFCFLPYVALIAIRIINEEKLLQKELRGYDEYMKKVRYRLIPFIW